LAHSATEFSDIRPGKTLSPERQQPEERREMTTKTQQTIADADPPLVPDPYLKRLKALPPSILAGVVWSLARQHTVFGFEDDTADVIAAEIKQISDDLAYLEEARAANEAIYQAAA
jgi:hypothetical protein